MTIIVGDPPRRVRLRRWILRRAWFVGGLVGSIRFGQLLDYIVIPALVGYGLYQLGAAEWVAAVAGLAWLRLEMMNR